MGNIKHKERDQPRAERGPKSRHAVRCCEVDVQEPGQRLIIDGWPMTHVPDIGSGHTYLCLGADEVSGKGSVMLTTKHTAQEWLLFVKTVQAPPILDPRHHAVVIHGRG